MKKVLRVLLMCGVVAGAGYAQETTSSSAPKVGVSENAKADNSRANGIAEYAALNRRMIEYQAQFDLLSQLAQEHRKRAGEMPGDQTSRVQWENDLARELDEKAAAALALLNNSSKERLAFEQGHPDLLTAGNAQIEISNRRNLDAVAFLGKLEERLGSVQQEIQETLETGNLYRAQLLTNTANTASGEYSRISALLQENGFWVKRLQAEAFELELKKLEFRALRRD